MFCNRCGKENDNNAKFCQACGAQLGEETIEIEIEEEKNNSSKTSSSEKTGDTISSLKTNSIALGVIAILLGELGIHNFIMGYTNRGLTQLLLTVIGWIVIVGPIISAVLAIIDAINLFTGKIDRDAFGNKLTK